MQKREAMALLDTIDVVYAAAVDPRLWDEVLTSITRLCGAEAAGIRVETTAVAQRWVGLDPAFDAAYVAEYWRDDPWAAPARNVDAGRVACGDEIVQRRTLEGTAFYNELCRPTGLDDLVGGVISSGRDRLVTIGVMGGRRVRFERTHCAVLERLLPHLSRALSIGERLLLAPVAGAASFDERLRARFHLTPAEARVAVEVGQGRATKDIALTLGVSVETVRTQLRAVFVKTATSSQRELERVLSQFPGLP